MRDLRSVRCILVPILQQVLDFGYQQTTSIVELWQDKLLEWSQVKANCMVNTWSKFQS